MQVSNPSKRAKKRPATGEVGSALRSVYDRALAEDIPPEMLDLLGKLGWIVPPAAFGAGE